MLRWFSVLLFISLALHSVSTSGDIIRWDSEEVIPGTEGITLGPNVQLDHMDLPFALLTQGPLEGANFESSNLSHAFFTNTFLRDANFVNSDLTEASFSGARLFLPTSLARISLTKI